ncbi:MAG: carotenoid biosynthesis protein, partial [Saprospiraceae bacterium]
MPSPPYFADVNQLIGSSAGGSAAAPRTVPVERYYAAFLLFAFGSGTLAHLLPAVYPITRLTTDGLLLVINGGLLYLVYRRNGDARLWAWLLFAYLVTFFTEVAGVATGAVFGSYQYGPTMWWQGWGVPFVIALNWAVLVLAANDLV